jgi:putative ATP-binding cassette transporter
MAFTQVLGAFSLLVSQFQQVSTYAAVTGRLGALWEATEPGAAPSGGPAAAPAPPRPAEANGPTAEAETAPAVEDVPEGRHVTFDRLTLRTPREGRPLVRDLSLAISEGRRVVITGPNGAGKSALLLAAAGLWAWGRGRVRRPAAPDVHFCPQRPHVMPGTLRELLLYGVGEQDISDERLRAVLREVGLEALADRAGGLDTEQDWPNVLSQGEQQALAFARLLLARPRFAFLDDAAGPLDPPRLERLYAALARTSITYVSAGHHPALLKYHELRLELFGDGSWRVGPAADEAPSPLSHASGESGRG